MRSNGASWLGIGIHARALGVLVWMLLDVLLLCEPSGVPPICADHVLVLLPTVTAATHGLQVVYAVVWYATGDAWWVDVVYCPVAAF